MVDKQREKGSEHKGSEHKGSDEDKDFKEQVKAHKAEDARVENNPTTSEESVRQLHHEQQQRADLHHNPPPHPPDPPAYITPTNNADPPKDPARAAALGFVDVNQDIRGKMQSTLQRVRKQMDDADGTDQKTPAWARGLLELHEGIWIK